jgi:hypothetical protein
VTRFSFPLLEVPASKPKFIERLEDDFIVREPQKEQPETTNGEKRTESAPRVESKPTSDEQSGQSTVTKPASEAPEEHQPNLNFGPKI